MKIDVKKVKGYNSTFKHIVMVSGKPICIVDSPKRASDIVSYLNGYDVVISDGRINKMLDKLRNAK